MNKRTNKADKLDKKTKEKKPEEVKRQKKEKPKGMPPEPYKLEEKTQFPDVLRRARGNISIACTNLNVSRQCYYDWCEQDKEFEKACKMADEYTKDYVESQLFVLIGQMNLQAIIFYLRKRAKDRGYGDGIEVTGSNGAPLFEDEKKMLENLSIQELIEYKKIRQKADAAKAIVKNA